MKESLINKLNKLKKSFFIKEDLNKNFKKIIPKNTSQPSLVIKRIF